MDRIKKEVNDCNKEVVRELSNLYTKLSDSLDKSYLYGQKSGYEEILAWFKQSQNKSIKYISPKSIKNYLIEKGAKSKLLLNEKTKNNNINNINNINIIKEDMKKKTNKTNFNYLYYNQTFNMDNNNNKNNNEKNIFPISVEAAFSNNMNKNKINNPFNSIIFGNNDFLNEQKKNVAILSNPSMNYNYSNNINYNTGIINNNMNDSQDEQMKPNSPLRNNYFMGNINLKRKKNS